MFVPLGNTEYRYRIVVVTERGEEVASAERSGAFHRWVDAWALPFEDRAFARLFAEQGRIFVLATTGRNRSPHLLAYDAGGALLERQLLPAFLPASAAAMAFAPVPDGGRLFLLANGGFLSRHIGSTTGPIS